MYRSPSYQTRNSHSLILYLKKYRSLSVRGLNLEVDSKLYEERVHGMIWSFVTLNSSGRPKTAVGAGTRPTTSPCAFTSGDTRGGPGDLNYRFDRVPFEHPQQKLTAVTTSATAVVGLLLAYLFKYRSRCKIMERASAAAAVITAQTEECHLLESCRKPVLAEPLHPHLRTYLIADRASAWGKCLLINFTRNESKAFQIHNLVTTRLNYFTKGTATIPEKITTLSVLLVQEDFRREMSCGHPRSNIMVTFLLSGGLCQGPIDDDIDIGGYTQAVPNKFALVRTFCRLRNPVMSVIE
ncbi:hypothetical protein J6590_084145 [Homalodisca vitripennis]|nr:hypothetical protein J6590_084145 [Homalodisca vitripennis]